MGRTVGFPAQFTVFGTNCWGSGEVYSVWDKLLGFQCSLQCLGQTVGFPVQFTVFGTNCWVSAAVYSVWEKLLGFR